jgi:4-amino-4-deoxy-L-arabinose transferase-like glycosyltransferase
VWRNQKSKIPLVFVVIAILAAIPFSLGKYFEFNQPDPFDGGGYAYSAKHILNGAKIGIEEKPSAQLGTLLVNMLGVALTGFNETGAKLVQTILQAAALLLMFIAIRKLSGSLSAAVGVIVASAYLSAPMIAKYGNVKEQYMIAFMVMGISCLILHQVGGRWWYAMLAGAFLSWAPLFKQTGVSAIAATGLFVILQPLLKNRTWKQAGIDILLLWAGVIAAIAPLYVWILVWNVQLSLPYSFVWGALGSFLPSSPGAEGAKVVSAYVTETRKLIPFAQQWPVVLRYYGLLILPIALAAGAIAARVVRMICSVASPDRIKPKIYDRFVLLLAIWWVLDMAFVWISSASYEQYYLPLNASAAMLGGYLVAIYSDYAKAAVYKTKPVIIGLVGLLAMIIMSWHIFFGIKTSPYTAQPYNGRQRGYSQKLEEISQQRTGRVMYPWEEVSEYIRTHSQPTDKIYVWGWYPGIYVAAQRFSAASLACSMPRPAPQALAQLVAQLLAEFQQQMPKFIVDSRKRHVPTDRPPYELWPIAPKGFMGMSQTWFLPMDIIVIGAYDKQWADMLRTRFDQDEALRYEALAPLRKFVMDNYEIVEPKQYIEIRNGQLYHRIFGEHVLFKSKTSPASKEPQ